MRWTIIPSRGVVQILLVTGKQYQISGQLRTYPFPNPTCYNKLVLLLGSGRGRCAVAQILILIRRFMLSKTGVSSASFPVVPASFNVTSPVKLVNLVPRVSPLPPLVVGRKTLVAAGHVPSCDTNFPTGVGSTNNFCRSQLKRKKGPSKFSSPVALVLLHVSFTQVR